ncbi:hypothetical protein [Actibacterium sp. 188UL27-1]|uniref:hypothetical protein n=1 Tax=Actibacterium sp. 188UL27-1 TaxID=2786961 RepID=UPI00195DD1CF|nr:hypothetical protein [Actibacterium sp. 188UL27-1]MBM7069044.1 hypothetical protein [Actibacterium sp. 188UL27-1]
MTPIPISKVLGDWLSGRDDIVSDAAYIGDGALRFTLTYTTAKANPSYGHLIVRANDVLEIPWIMVEMCGFAAEALLQGEFVAKQLAFDPGRRNTHASRHRHL